MSLGFDFHECGFLDVVSFPFTFFDFFWDWILVQGDGLHCMAATDSIRVHCPKQMPLNNDQHCKQTKQTEKNKH